jgi:hypothetical protein
MGFVAFVTWVLLCFVAASAAKKRGRSFGGYLVLSLFLSPLIGIIVVLVLGETEELQKSRVINIDLNINKVSNERLEHTRIVTPAKEYYLPETNTRERMIESKSKIVGISSISESQQTFTRFIEKDWKDILLENDLEEYVDIFEKNKLTNLEIIIELTESDLEKLGIMVMGDRKKILKIYSANKNKKENVVLINEMENTWVEKEDFWDEKNRCWICGKCGTQNYLKKCTNCGKGYNL